MIIQGIEFSKKKDNSRIKKWKYNVTLSLSSMHVSSRDKIAFPVPFKIPFFHPRSVWYFSIVPPAFFAGAVMFSHDREWNSSEKGVSGSSAWFDIEGDDP